MTNFIYAILGLLLLAVLPGSAWAELYERGDQACTDFSEEAYRSDPDDLYNRSAYASCLVIKGKDNEGLPELYTLADDHNDIPASYFIANYLRTNGKLDGTLTKTNIDEALTYFFRTLALIDLKPHYPGEEFRLYESVFQAGLGSWVELPILYLEKYKLGVGTDYCKRAIAHGYKENCPIYQDLEYTTMDSLKKIRQYAGECAGLPQKRHFKYYYYQAVIGVCSVEEELASNVIPLEEKRLQVFLRPDCQNPLDCEDHDTLLNEIFDLYEQYLEKHHEIFDLYLEKHHELFEGI